MKFNQKLFLILISIFMSSQIKAGPYLAICQKEAEKLNKQIKEVKSSELSLWKLKPSYCETATPKDNFVYEYVLKDKHNKDKNIINHIKANAKQDRKNMLGAVCNDEFLSNMIKFFDIKYSYKQNKNKKLVSFVFAIKDCGVNDRARKNFEQTKESKKRLNKIQKDANDAMQIYNR
jgi:hypothetical protein